MISIAVIASITYSSRLTRLEEARKMTMMMMIVTAATMKITRPSSSRIQPNNLNLSAKTKNHHLHQRKKT